MKIFNKLCLIFLMSLCFFVIIGSVSAEESVEVHTFDEMNSSIVDGKNVILGNNITIDNPTEGIVISRNVVVDGQGYTIDAQQNGRFFNITNSDAVLTLININLINGFNAMSSG